METYLANRIRDIRKKNKLTQKELAQKTGLSIASIQGYEQGKYKPKIEQLRKIANILNVTVIANNGQFDLIENNQSIIKQITHITVNELMSYPELDQALSDYVNELFSGYQLFYDPIANDSSPSGLKCRCEIYNAIIHHVNIKTKNGFTFFDIYPMVAVSPAPNSTQNYLIQNYSSLNNKGQNKLVEYAEDLAKIPEYRRQQPDTSKDSTLQEEQTEDPDNIITIDPTLNAAHAMNPTEEEKKHADDIMKDDSEWK